MANTIIQIKRSSTTATPTGGTLAAAEQAYSFLSDKLFIGDAAGTGVVPIGGKFYVDQQNTIFDIANAAFNAANSAGSLAVINLIFDTANAGFNLANTSLQNSGTQSLAGDLNITGNLTVTGLTTYVNTATLLVSDNIFVLNSDLDGATAPTQDAGMEVNRGSSDNVAILWNETDNKWTFTNNGTNYEFLVGATELGSVATSANAYASAVGTSANAYADVVGTSANAFASGVGTSANTYADAVGVSANAYARVFANSVGTSANNYAGSLANTAESNAISVAAAYYSTGNNHMINTTNALRDYVNTAAASANTNAANGSYISAGIVKVPYGGTGVTSFTTNGILFGNNSGDLKVTGAGTEGQVLVAGTGGVPAFQMLDGGAF